MARRPDYTQDFGIAHKGTARAGAYVTIAGKNCSGLSDCPRGHAAIEDDGATLFYRVARKEAGAFRRWAESVFLSSDGRDRLRGAFPRYWVANR